jgi:hypothetical protein
MGGRRSGTFSGAWCVVAAGGGKVWPRLFSDGRQSGRNGRPDYHETTTTEEADVRPAIRLP